MSSPIQNNKIQGLIQNRPTVQPQAPKTNDFTAILADRL